MSALTDKVNELSQAIAAKEEAEQVIQHHRARVEQVYVELRDLLDGKAPNSAPELPAEEVAQ